MEAFSVRTILGSSQFGDVWLWFLHVAPTPVKGLLMHISQYDSFLLHTLVFLDSRALRSWKDVRTALQLPAYERKVRISKSRTLLQVAVVSDGD